MSNIQSIGAKKTVLDDLNLHGYVRLPFKLMDSEIEALRALFDDPALNGEINNLISTDKTQNFARKVLDILGDNQALFREIDFVLGEEATISRTLFLQKTEISEPSDWHQNVTLVTKISPSIPPSFGPVTYKDGVAHVKATEQFLAGFMTARIYLDEAEQDKGALDIIPGSHKRGRVPIRTMSHSIVDDIPAFVPAQSGEIHFFRPLIILRSGAVKHPIKRRVIQLEMTPKFSLPLPLVWHDPVAIF